MTIGETEIKTKTARLHAIKTDNFLFVTFRFHCGANMAMIQKYNFWYVIFLKIHVELMEFNIAYDLQPQLKVIKTRFHSI